MSPLAFALVGPAGAAGALARVALDRVVSRRFPPGVGIGVVNVVACLLLGAAAARLDGTALAVVSTGFLGGFSTFSTAALDLVFAARTSPWRALALGAGVLVLSVGACALGAALAA